jgi:tRNA (cmo5U34)-methyltransferase
MTFPIPETWTFENSDVADHFDQHVREQLPWYELVTSAVVQIGRHYIGKGGLVYDIGASNGNVGRALAPLLTERSATLVGIEESAAMVERYDVPGFEHVEQADAVTYDYKHCDFAVAMLAMMFLRPEDVPRLLFRLRASLTPGGAIVLVERTMPPSGYPSVVTSRLTLAAKAAMGADSRSIVAKELSLAGVQRPLDPRMLASLGAVEWFRFGDFAGYVIEAAA